MKTLTNALLFNLFTSYLEDMVQVAEELPAAYDNFVTLLGELPQNEGQILKLRRLNYTKIELTSMQIVSEQMLDKRHVLYDVFIGKALSLLDTEIEMVKELFKYGNIIPELKPEIMKGTKDKSVVMLTWNGTDSDLIELVAALMAADAISSRNGDKLTVISVIRAFEDMFHLKINALYTKRGKVFDRCTDTTPFIDSLRVSYNRMLEKRLI
ncbi:RteC domain-containing protein [Phocaeicola dorei]|uniref:RteC domain-containing protein n=1 Tax=Bacteroidaceae TaxID=815 RepID=UPI00189C34EC|nr:MULTISPECIES: RteC domain-containing protein [Bacteroidaceae]MBV4238656.1 RteC domain-containing protein [Phocaeicola dorei]MCB6461234.1 RteC domain-containing protein [Phocaeicola dorei]MCB6746573.1 RteC domain-containing protein [Phocaeicola dorei]MCB6772017.1 RteC domain-containing protein [Phocaeicola dorei]MCB6790773.1 RteC domain-containing protein [Phocaeicola dorei]